jgi:hypothetical protein
MFETSYKYDWREYPKILLLKVILKFIYGKFYQSYYSLRSKINQFLESSKIKLSLSLTNFVEKIILPITLNKYIVKMICYDVSTDTNLVS